MSIWKRAATPEAANARLAMGAAGVFGIRITAIPADCVRAAMTIGPNHLQPHGIVHGGVSVVPSETLGTFCTILTLPEGRHAVGIEVNANHLAMMRPGETVTAECRRCIPGGPRRSGRPRSAAPMASSPASRG